jgi:glyoxylase-like metal-dependent hydrolase (beta-lactamase superfamily II)
MEAANDTDFRPDHAMADGDVASGDGFALEAVTTPGHTANHVAFALKGTDVMFSGDHVMGWSTTIVAPPDGAMTDYMDSLNKLTARAETLYLPGHGGAIREAPRFVAGLILPRKAREASILHRLAKGATDIATIVRAIYIGLDPRLTNAAGFSVLAHMEDLVARGEVATEGPPSINGVYRLART